MNRGVKRAMRQTFQKNIYLASAAILLAGAGCSTVDPYTGEQTTSEATKFGGLGAAAGAIVGASVSSKGNRAEGAVIGGAIGALGGAAIGVHFDRKNAAKRKELEAAGVRVERSADGRELTLVLPGNLTFASGSATLDSSSYQVLNSISDVLSAYNDSRITLVGYTDSTGNALQNQSLSQARASAVRDYLISNGDIGAGRFDEVYGAGASNFIQDNATPEGRAANRRVEITLK